MKNARKILITLFFGVCLFLINDTTVLANCGHGAYVYDGGDVPYDCYTDGGCWERCRVCGDRRWKTKSGHHDWSLDYHSIDDEQHGKQCKKRYLGWPEGTRRCPEMRYQAHSKTGYYSDGQGNYVNRCKKCNWIKSEYITYTVVFHSNYPGGISGHGSMANQGFTYATGQNLYANQYGYSYTVNLDTNKGIYDSVPQLNGSTRRTGNSHFAGWAKSSSGSKAYDDRQMVNNLTVEQHDTINLYAKWGTVDLNLPSPTRTGFDFAGWYTAPDGGTNVGSGNNYTPAGNVTFYARWSDRYAPANSISIDPKDTWISGNGTVTVTAQDNGTGLDTITIKRRNVNSGAVTTVATFQCNGTTDSVTKTYTETSEGVFEYTCEAKDRASNVGRSSAAGRLQIDHSNPVIRGLDSVNTEWTNIAPSIAVTTTDYLQGTTYAGSGVGSVKISDHDGTVVVSGTSAATYVVPASYEGEWSWTITIEDNVGHVTTDSITTRYDITGPDISGTDADVLQDGVHYSGYCEDNIIDQHIWDDPAISVNLPNVTSGIRNVMFYKVDDEGTKTPLHSYAATFGTSDMNNSHSIYYDAEEEGDEQESYEIVAEDFAGNITRKRLVTQQSILSRFRTSIDRSSYE